MCFTWDTGGDSAAVGEVVRDSNSEGGESVIAKRKLAVLSPFLRLEALRDVDFHGVAGLLYDVETGFQDCLAHSRTVAACIQGKDVPLHHHRFDGGMITSGF